ncbi:MAG: DUF72 domain-containing protein [Candidatus Altiarchaeota archaeon]|nr:DUF72 domain-containing protein [Candidatus Altiarchaeota archaeon]
MTKAGCSGWAYLPKKYVKPGESRLQSYARIFKLAEVNSTFYQLPKTSTAKGWRKEVDEINPEFEFTVKVPKLVTHVSHFTDMKTWEKIKDIANALRANIMLIRTPKTFEANTKNIKKLGDFFKAVGSEFQFVIESDGWGKETLEKHLPNLGLIHAVDIFKETPIKQKFNYFRLQGIGDSMYRYRFKDEDLEKVQKIVSKKDYVLFNNIFMYDDCMRFLELMK